MQKRFVVAAVVAVVVLVVGAAIIIDRFRYGRVTLPAQYYQAQKSQLPTNAAQFDHVVIIVEENKPRGAAIGNADAPYINQLARTYAYATHYYAVTNPSLPNYIALTSGSTAGITNDCNPPGGSCMADVTSIADRLEQAHKTWKLYAESMPQTCYTSNSGNYAVKHNPFLYYTSIARDVSRCRAHDVPLDVLTRDLASVRSLPEYVFITPNLCNDMHNCSVRTGDDWLAVQVPKILGSPAFTTQHSLLVIVWDEGNTSDNNVTAVFAGSAAKRGYISTRYYSHYSLLRTVESNWHLSPLTNNDRTAPPMTDMLR